MSYFRNFELANKYRISEGTVRNWIKSVHNSRIKLMLHEEKGKFYIANTPANATVIEKLVQGHRKYRNSVALKTVKPKPKFYETFSKRKAYEIVRNIEMYHEIPRQYNYFDRGAHEWNDYAVRLAEEEAPNLLNSTIKLLLDSQEYMDRLLTKYKSINVVDIGPGNALPVKNLLSHLLEQGKLGRYVAIDISPAMLEITKHNIAKWFNDTVTYEEHELDITHERFGGLLAHDYLENGTEEHCNLFLLLGGTPDNLRKPDDAFWAIHESMNVNDLLIYTDKLETEDMRPQWFDYNTKPGKLTLTLMHRVVFDMLNIDTSFYDVEMGFDARLGQRYTRARFKLAVALQFKFGDSKRSITIEKGDTILLWRSWQVTNQNYMQQFIDNDFYVSHVSQTENRQYAMVIAQAT